MLIISDQTSKLKNILSSSPNDKKYFLSLSKFDGRMMSLLFMHQFIVSCNNKLMYALADESYVNEAIILP